MALTLGDDGLNSASVKRRSQLDRWEHSDTNQELPYLKKDHINVKFPEDCVFLAACSQGDTKEVKRLIDLGCNINTGNVDGLTALHQACIDGKLDMVKFLTENKAYLDVADNEGWTPLHATANCGYLDIAKYLLEHGANVVACNSDGELPVDITDDDEMRELLQNHMERLGLDPESARNEEEDLMFCDANSWLSSRTFRDQPHPKSGATALHVAAAKGYTRVIKVLIDAGANLDAEDHDGWTALHAAAHWGQEEPCRQLAESMCNMEAKTPTNQSVFDVAAPELLDLLQELKEKQVMLRKDNPTIITNKPVPPLRRRSSVTRLSRDEKHNIVIRNVEEERAQLEAQLLKDENAKVRELSESESSSSESDTEKQNEINRHVEVDKDNEQNESERDASTPRIHDLVNDVDSEMEQEPVRLAKREREPSPESDEPVRDRVRAPKYVREAPDDEKERSSSPEKEEKDSSSSSSSKESSSSRETSPKESMSKDSTPKDSSKESTPAEEERIGVSRLKEPSPPVREPSPTIKDDSSRSQSGSPVRDMTATSTGVDSNKRPPYSHLRNLEPEKDKQEPIKRPEYEPDSLAARRRAREERIAARRLLQQQQQQESIRQQQEALRPTQDSKITEPSVSVSVNTERRRLLPPQPHGSLATTTTGFHSNATLSTSASTTTTTTTATMTTTSGVANSNNQYTSSMGNVTSSMTSSNQRSAYIPLSRRHLLDTKPALSASNVTSIASFINKRQGQYQPPQRDEETETQRKARARRARETRRSTQGVTMEDIEKAQEQSGTAPSTADNKTTSSSTARPRLRVEDKVRQDDKENKPEVTSSSSSWRRNDYRKDSDPAAVNTSTSSISTTGSTLTNNSTNTSTGTAPSTTTNTNSTGTGSYRSRLARENNTDCEKDEPKTSSAIRARRRREERRSTGKVDWSDIVKADEHEKSVQNENKTEDNRTSEPSRSKYGLDLSDSYSSSTGSTSLRERPSSPYYSRSATTTAAGSTTTSTDSRLDGKDYKKLYEDERVDNERLRLDLTKTQQELTEQKSKLDDLRKERRALDRKMSEKDEELRSMNALKEEIKRLKEENGALIRVISKLSK